MASNRNKKWRAFAALAVPLLLAPACGSDDDGGGGGGDEQATVELRFSWWGSDTRHEITNQVIEKFEAAHPDIKITGDFTGWDGYWEKLATTVGGGDTPDIMQMEWRYVREYADRGVLRDLSELVDTENIDERVVATGEVDDSLLAVPAGINAFCVVADPAVFQEAGVAMPDDTSWTWEDYQRIAAEISESTPDDVYGAQDKSYNETNLQVFARQRGETLYTPEGQLGMSDQTIAEWWQVSLDMQKAGGIPSASVTAELEAAGVDQSLLATNKGALGFWWTNELTALSESSGRELELLRFPGESSGQAGMYLKPSMFFSISSKTEHPEEAAEFVNFLVNDQAAAEIMLSERGLPPNTEIREAVQDKLTDVDVAVSEFITEISGGLGEPPQAPPQGAGDVSQIVQRVSDEVLFERMSVADAARQFREEAEAAIG